MGLFFSCFHKPRIERIHDKDGENQNDVKNPISKTILADFARRAENTQHNGVKLAGYDAREQYRGKGEGGGEEGENRWSMVDGRWSMVDGRW